MAGFVVKFVREEYIPLVPDKDAPFMTYGELLDNELVAMIKAIDGDGKGMIQEIALQLSDEDSGNLLHMVRADKYRHIGKPRK